MKRYKVHDDHVPVICKAHHSDHQHIVPRAATPRNTIKNPAVFIIDYDDNIPVNAIPAVEFAAEILSAGLSSTIPIRVQVIWGAQNIESGTLAFARPSEYIVDFPNSTEKVAYPIALAEKLSGMHINSESEPDIIVTVNSDKQWYYGFDNPEGIRNGEFDLATVMLHEVTHGLGFTGFAGIADDGVTGFMKFNFDTGNFDKNGTPVIFNLYNTDGSGQNLCRSFEDQTTRLGNALLSNNLFLNLTLDKKN